MIYINGKETLTVNYGGGGTGGGDGGDRYSEGYEAGYNTGYNEGNTAGYDDGYTLGHRSGVEEGKQAEYDAFWDAFQQNGARKNYNYTFSRWNEACFKPKYDITVDGTSVGTVQGVFDTCQINRSLVDILNECGVSLKFVNCINKNLYNTFSYSLFTEINFVLENSATAKINTTFYACENLKTVRIIGLSETNTLNQVVDKCPSLENFTIEGTIGQNGLNFQWSTKLSHDSLMSIITALKDYSADTSGTVYTVTLGSENLAKLTNEEKDLITMKGWDYE